MLELSFVVSRPITLFHDAKTSNLRSAYHFRHGVGGDHKCCTATTHAQHELTAPPLSFTIAAGDVLAGAAATGALDLQELQINQQSSSTPERQGEP
jgi:hypothetical protein